MKNKFSFAFLLVILPLITLQSQDLLSEKSDFTHQDTLRGSITPERAWWDLTY